MPNEIAVILNISAGGDDKKALVDNLTAMFRSGGFDACVTLASSGPQIIEAVRHAARQKPWAVVAGGGDGTMNAVASILVGSGSLSGFCRWGRLIISPKI